MVLCCRDFGTFQELLAPERLKFFDQKWRWIGHLDGQLAEMTAKATGIDISLLRYEKILDDFSIPQKLSWASRRRTTKLEDRAYSLLGILNVQMDLRCGEGELAFRRLQREILKQPEGLAILSWRSVDESRRMHLLAASPDDSVDCEDVLYDPSIWSGSEVWLTNFGLKGSLPIVQEPSSKQDFLVLGCHSKELPERSLGLLLTKVNRSAHFYAVSAVFQEDELSTGFLRLAPINFFDVAKVQEEDVTILWQSVSIEVPLDLGAFNTMQDQIPPESEDYAISYVNPRHLGLNETMLTAAPNTQYCKLPINRSKSSSSAQLPASPRSRLRHRAERIENAESAKALRNPKDSRIPTAIPTIKVSGKRTPLL